MNGEAHSRPHGGSRGNHKGPWNASTEVSHHKHVVRHAEALYAYEARDEEELSVKPGDKVKIHEMEGLEPGWVMAENEETGSKKRALLPENYLRVIHNYNLPNQG